MKASQVVLLIGASLLYISPVYALFTNLLNYRVRENVVKGADVKAYGLFQSAIPQRQTVIAPLLKFKRAGNCNAGFSLCGDNCVSDSDTCCIDTRSGNPSGTCSFENAVCCLNIGTNDAFCCQPGWQCTFDTDGCSSLVTVTTIHVTPPTPPAVIVTADPPPAPTTTVPGPPPQTFTVTPPQVVLTVTQSPRTVTVTQSLGGTTVILTSGTTTTVATT